jgi:hypothetical protein
MLMAWHLAKIFSDSNGHRRGGICGEEGVSASPQL